MFAPSGTAPASDGWPWTLRILANADSRAELHPCHCAGGSVGGLALRSALFKRVRAGRTDLLVVDGGDFTPGPEETLATERGAFMLEVMPLMAYDAVAVGELDLVGGLDRLRRTAGAVPLVCANLELAPGVAEIPSVRWVEYGGRRVAVTAFLDPVLFYELPGALDVDPDSLLVSDPAAGLARALDEIGEGADLVVLLAHGSETVLVEILPPQGVDVVLLGHEHEADRYPGEAPFVLRPGEHSRAVADLEITLPAPRRAELVSFRLWDLKRQTRTDSRIEEMVEEFEANPGGS
jgi:2',3'-cyclic-nucleotide 2'-phosphodiesterase (5'-nucleotidase family)